MRSSRLGRSRSRLCLRTLEDRITPATDTFTNLAGGAWTTNGNWDLNHPPQSADVAVIPDLNSGAVVTISSGTNVVSGLTLSANASLTLSSANLTITGSGTIAGNLSVTLGSTLTDNGNVTFASGDVVTLVGYSSTQQIVVGNGGVLNATSTTFTASGYSNTGLIVVNGGGHLLASGSTFASSLNQVDLNNGIILNAGDLIGNSFNCPLYVPEGKVQFLSGTGSDNAQFQDINILAGGVPSGQTLTLNAIGTNSTANLRYVFPGAFAVASGATLNVAANLPVQLQPGVILTDNGTVIFSSSDDVNLAGYSSTQQIVVGNGGVLNATGTTFTASGYNNTGLIVVNGGGHLLASGSTFASSLNQVDLNNGSLLFAGDLIGNSFNCPLYLPEGEVQFLSGTGSDNAQFQDIDILAGSVPSGQTLALKAIGTSSTANLRYLFSGAFAVASGATLNVAANLSVQLQPGVILTDNGTLIFSSSDVVNLAGYSSTQQIVVGNGGVLNAIGTTFTASGYSNTGLIVVSAGGHLLANGSTFASSLNQIDLNNGSLLFAGDLIGNSFNCPLYLPEGEVQFLSGAGSDNAQFQDINILAGSVPTGQTLALNAIGTATTANLRYLFPGVFTVASGATLNVAANLSVQLQPGVTLTDYGTMIFRSYDAVNLAGYSSTQQIVVGNGGVLNATGTTFTASGYNNTGLIVVNGGGHLFASGSTFGSSLNQVDLNNGSLLNTGDLVGNSFNCPLYLPEGEVQFLSGAGSDNAQFQDINILAGSVPSGQTLALNSIGTATTANLRYLFSGALVVANGATLTVAANLPVQLQPGVTLTNNGTLILNTGDVVNLAGYSSTQQIVVGNGGVLNAASTTFAASGYNNTGLLTVNSGGQVTAINSSFALANVTLNSGSTDQFQFVSFANKLTISSGAAINIHLDDFSNTLANGGVIATGASTAHIDLTNNFWGTTDPLTIATRIHDHLDDITLPYIDFSPPLSSPESSFFNPASLPLATAGLAYNQTIAAVAGTGPANNFAVSNGVLPAGLSLTTAGVLSGTPTVAGAFTITISASDPSASGGTADQIYWLFVNDPIFSFTPATLPATKSGVFYNQPLSVTGGTAPYSSFVVSSGALPNGLSLSLAGTISGTPSVDGTFNFTVTAQDSTTGLAAPYTGNHSYTIAVDDTPPTAGTVNDGSGADIDFQTSLTSISASWAGFADPDSGIASYAWAIGTTPGGTDVQVFTNVGTALNASASGLNLSDGTKYYVSVEAIDNAGNVSSPAISDGVSVDASGPTPGTVNDGAGADIDIQGSQSTIAANWTGFTDSGSGLASFKWAIGTTPGGTEVQAFTNVGAATSASATGLSLVRGTKYYVSVKATDNLGNVGSAASSNGVTVETPSPVITSYSVDSGVVGDGITNDKTPTLTGSAEIGSTIQVFDGLNPIGTTATDLVGSWQFTTGNLPDGLHHLGATATDTGGHTSPLSTALDVTIDTTSPTATIDQAGGQTEPTNVSPIAFTVHFNEPVTGFSAAGIDFTGSTVAGSTVQSITGSGTDYTVTVTGMSGQGNVVASVLAGAAIDVAGNSNVASTSTDNSVGFDNVPPTVTVTPDASQADPTDAGPIMFAVHFSEPVTGFSEADVDLSASGFTGLSKSFSGSGSDYTLSVTGMFGAGDVIASVVGGAAIDAAGNASTPSANSDNKVHYNHVGALQFNVASLDTFEGDTSATVMVERINGGDGPTQVSYSTHSGTATSDVDYTLTSGTLSWTNGDTAPKPITVPITVDSINEGRERFTLDLSSPTNGAVLGSQSTATYTIAKSNGATINALDKSPQITIPDSDGDQVTLKLAGKVGTLTYYETNGSGPIAEIDLVGTDSSKSVVSVTVKKVGGDGRTTIGAIDGTGVKSLALTAADLDGSAGNGILLTSFLGSISIGAIENGADIMLAGAPPKTGLGTKITAGVIGDGTDLAIKDAPLASLTATRVGVGTITAPSVGAITIKGKAKTKTAAAIAGDFKSNLTIAGTGLLAKAMALKSLKVAGTVSGSSIVVGGLVGTIGDVGSVSVGSFVNSELDAGYDSIHGFNLPSTIGSFTVTGKTNAFSESNVIAANFKNVVLASVDPVVGGPKFGFVYDTLMKALSVKSPKFIFDPKDLAPQGLPSGSDFEVKKA